MAFTVPGHLFQGTHLSPWGQWICLTLGFYFYALLHHRDLQEAVSDLVLEMRERVSKEERQKKEKHWDCISS
jgi:hypothetical protein